MPLRNFLNNQKFLNMAAIQMTSGLNIGENLIQAGDLIKKAVDKGAGLVALPENFACMTKDPRDIHSVAEYFGHGRIQEWASRLAEKLNIWIIAGTLPIKSNKEKEQDLITLGKRKIRAACLVFNDNGLIVGRYDKMHLFDVKISTSGEIYQESNQIEPGDQVVVIDSPFGKLGLSVCYDLRFPELYRKLREKNADIFFIPSAFTYTTGLAHWEILLRARAIENQCVVVAPAQAGTHENGRKTYGHSCIIDAWGNFSDQSLPADQPGFAISKIDLLASHVLREEFPVFENRKIKS